MKIRLCGVYIWIMVIAIMQVPLIAHAQVSNLRLTGKTTYKRDSFNYTRTDSIGYKYTGKRTSNMKTGVYQYDTSVIYADAGSGLYPVTRLLRVYSSADRITTHTVQQYRNGIWRNVEKYLYSYLSAGEYDSVVTQVWDSTAAMWNTKRLQKYIYNAGALDSITWLKPNGSLWKVEAGDKYTYNSGNLILHTWDVWNDTLSRMDRWQQEEYTYYSSTSNVKTYINKSIDVPTITLANRRKNDYYYDASNRVAQLDEHAWFDLSGKWEGTYQHYYSYTQHGDVDMETINYWDLGAQMWGPLSRLYHGYDASFMLTDITETRFVFPSYENFAKQEWVYNSQSLPVTYRRFYWYAPTNFWRPEIGFGSQVNYYYEQYDTSTYVQTLKQPIAEMNVFPNPATGYVTISFKGADNKPFTVLLYDMQGRPVKAWFVPVAMQAGQQLELNGIAKGQYILHAVNGKEEMTKRLVIGGE